ncbi:MAG: hypothetical protein ABJB16_06685 [Saprospiraceae bacterium]
MARILDLKKWRKFLKSQGLIFKRSVGGHEIWDYPDDSLLRPVIYSAHDKEIAIYQITTNLKTLNLTMEDLDIWLGRSSHRP